VQTDMLDAATARRNALICDCTTLDAAREVAQTGVARVPWGVLGVSGEATLASGGVTVRCHQRDDGTLPDTDDDESEQVVLERAY